MFDLISAALSALLCLGAALLLPRAGSGAASDRALSTLLGASLLMVLPLLALGYLGWLDRRGLLLVQACLLLALALARRHSIGSLRSSAASECRALATTLKGFRPGERALLALIALLFLTAAVSILFSVPAVYDSLAYRLPRIGHWIQEASILHFPTGDERQNWMPLVPDLLMTWVTLHTRPFFYGVQFAQLFGGLLAALGVYRLGAACGLGRAARLTAVLLFLSIPSVFVQLMSSHTDLVTAGFTVAGLAFLCESFKTGRFRWEAGAAWALAFASKGILFYWVLGLPVLLGLLVLRARAPLRLLGAHALAFAAFAAAVLAPRHIENQLQYGNPFANEDLIERHHPDLSASEGIRKMRLNAGSYALQLFEPFSNPPLVRGPLAALGKSLAEALPESGDFLFDQDNRRQAWLKLFNRSISDVDGLSFGVYFPLLVLAGAFLIAFRFRKSPFDAFLLGGLSASVLLFLLFFAYKQNAHLYAFRYFIIIAGPLALLAAALLEGFAARARAALGLLLCLPALATLPGIWLNNGQIGFNNIFHPREIQQVAVVDATRRLLERAPANQASSVFLQVPYNYPKAGFYASGLPIHEIADHPQRDREMGSVVPNALIADQTVPLFGRSFISVPRGGGFDFDVAFVRPARPGESPPPFIHGYRGSIADGSLREEFLVYPNGRGTLEAKLVNASERVHRVAWSSGDDRGDLSLGPGESRRLSLPLKSARSPIRLEQQSVAEAGATAAPASGFQLELIDVLYPIVE